MRNKEINMQTIRSVFDLLTTDISAIIKTYAIKTLTPDDFDKKIKLIIVASAAAASRNADIHGAIIKKEATVDICKIIMQTDTAGKNHNMTSIKDMEKDIVNSYKISYEEKAELSNIKEQANRAVTKDHVKSFLFAGAKSIMFCVVLIGLCLVAEELQINLPFRSLKLS